MSEIHEEYSEFVARMMQKDGVAMPLEYICLGLAGETAEFEQAYSNSCAWKGEGAETKVIEELGDFRWYLTALGISVGLPDTITADDDHGGLNQDVGAICELVKKHRWHGKPLDMDRLCTHIANLNVELFLLEAELLVTDDEVCLRNMQKLKARYPGGFVEGGGIR